jgi:hypothetical protein
MRVQQSLATTTTAAAAVVVCTCLVVLCATPTYATQLDVERTHSTHRLRERMWASELLETLSGLETPPKPGRTRGLISGFNGCDAEFNIPRRMENTTDTKPSTLSAAHCKLCKYSIARTYTWLKTVSQNLKAKGIATGSTPADSTSTNPAGLPVTGRYARLLVASAMDKEYKSQCSEGGATDDEGNCCGVLRELYRTNRGEIVNSMVTNKAPIEVCYEVHHCAHSPESDRRKQAAHDAASAAAHLLAVQRAAEADASNIAMSKPGSTVSSSPTENKPKADESKSA